MPLTSAQVTRSFFRLTQEGRYGYRRLTLTGRLSDSFESCVPTNDERLANAAFVDITLAGAQRPIVRYRLHVAGLVSNAAVVGEENNNSRAEKALRWMNLRAALKQAHDPRRERRAASLRPKRLGRGPAGRQGQIHCWRGISRS